MEKMKMKMKKKNPDQALASCAHDGDAEEVGLAGGDPRTSAIYSQETASLFHTQTCLERHTRRRREKKGKRHCCSGWCRLVVVVIAEPARGLPPTSRNFEFR